MFRGCWQPEEHMRRSNHTRPRAFLGGGVKILDGHYIICCVESGNCTRVQISPYIINTELRSHTLLMPTTREICCCGSESPDFPASNQRRSVMIPCSSNQSGVGFYGDLTACRRPRGGGHPAGVIMSLPKSWPKACRSRQIS
jgi:hypothetical protein